MNIPLTRWRRYLWLLAPFILVAAIACGSDDDDVVTAAPTTAPAVATATTAPAVATTAPDTSGGDEGSKEIQFLFGIENSGIYTVVRDPAKARAEELGWTLLEGAANGDQQANVNALEAAVARGVAAIVVNPIGGGPLYEEAVKLAIDAGIPVFGYADSVEGQTGLIGFDHGQGGRLLGEEAARWFTEEYTGDKSTFSWATFNFDQGGPSPTARMVEFEKAFVAVTGIEKSRTAEAVSEEQGLNAAETFLQVDPGLDMIAGVNDAGALGAHQAFLDQIASTGRDPGEIFLGGIDGQNEAIELIATGGGPQGIYRASAALNMTEAGRAVVDIPIGVIERGEGGSVLLNFAIFSRNDTAAATKFFKAIAGRDPVGTGPTAAASTGDGGSKEIQFLFGIENSGIYPVVRDPAKARAEELGWTLLEGAANGDQQANVNALEAAVARGVAAIVVNPIGGGPLYEEAVKKAIDAGIPVFGYADTVEGQTGLIGFDHGQGGKLLGEEAARWFTEDYTGDKSTFSWATFNFDQGGPSPTARMVEFEKAFVAVTGIEKSRTAEAVSEEQGLNAALTFLQVDPGLDMIIGVNDAGALGAHQAFLDQIASTGRDPGEVFLGGIDGQTEAIVLIAGGGGPEGIYRASAALNMTEAGRAVVDIPIGVIERGEGGSVLLNFAIFSPNDTARAQKFLDAITGN